MSTEENNEWIDDLENALNHDAQVRDRAALIFKDPSDAEVTISFGRSHVALEATGPLQLKPLQARIMAAHLVSLAARVEEREALA